MIYTHTDTHTQTHIDKQNAHLERSEKQAEAGWIWALT
jgi:hypothetical protein